ncbi:hypothetical protein [Azotobacter vinelandii]|uniref:hypothetical protein n=1 Tax=Azotobacter vinelandii TaxID=354 RepID=UPI000774147D|nr:hypothetical protein [Azotobacter vinelandii]
MLFDVAAGHAASSISATPPAQTREPIEDIRSPRAAEAAIAHRAVEPRQKAGAFGRRSSVRRPYPSLLGSSPPGRAAERCKAS